MNKIFDNFLNKIKKYLVYIGWPKLVFSVFCVIYVLLVSVYLVSNYGNNMKWPAIDKLADTEASRAMRINNVVDLANQAELDSGIDAVAAVYENAIKLSIDNYEKSVLTVAKATLYYNALNYDKAIIFAKDALSYDKNESSFSFIAQAYEKKSMNREAVDCYRKAILLIDWSKPSALDDESYYRYKIKELSND